MTEPKQTADSFHGLTKEEYIEREVLLEKQRITTTLFSQDEFDRLKELSNKMYLNSGSPTDATTPESKKTAVEWLKEQLPSLFVDDSGHYKAMFDKALRMEREQIADAIIEASKFTFKK
mgnify:CR=1 FL=1